MMRGRDANRFRQGRGHSLAPKRRAKSVRMTVAGEHDVLAATRGGGDPDGTGTSQTPARVAVVLRVAKGEHATVERRDVVAAVHRDDVDRGREQPRVRE